MLIPANDVITPEFHLLKQFALTDFVSVIILCVSCGSVCGCLSLQGHPGEKGLHLNARFNLVKKR